MSLSVSSTLINCQSDSDQFLSSSQLAFSRSLQEFCNESVSCSAILGLAFGRTLGILAKSQSVHLFSSYFGTRTTHFGSAAIGFAMEGASFHSISTWGATGTFQLGAWNENLHSALTLALCHGIGKRFSAAGIPIQHLMQNGGMVTLDLSLEYFHIVEQSHQGVIERFCNAEIMSFRMEISAKFLATTCPQVSYIQAKMEIHATVSEKRVKKQGSGTEYFGQEFATVNGASVEGLKEYLEAEREKREGVFEVEGLPPEGNPRQKLNGNLPSSQHPAVIDFLRYPESLRVLVIETWENFYQSGGYQYLQPRSHYKDRARSFLATHPKITEIEDLDLRAHKVREVLDIGYLCFAASSPLVVSKYSSEVAHQGGLKEVHLSSVSSRPTDPRLEWMKARLLENRQKRLPVTQKTSKGERVKKKPLQRESFIRQLQEGDYPSYPELKRTCETVKLDLDEALWIILSVHHRELVDPERGHPWLKAKDSGERPEEPIYINRASKDEPRRIQSYINNMGKDGEGTYGQWIYWRRRRKGLTRPEMVSLMNGQISETRLQKLEENRVEPTESENIILSSILEIEVKVLTQRSENTVFGESTASLSREYITLSGRVNWDRLLRKRPRMTQFPVLLQRLQQIQAITAEELATRLNEKFTPHLSLSRSFFYQREFYIGAEIQGALESFPWLHASSQKTPQPNFGEAVLFARAGKGWSLSRADREYHIDLDDLTLIEKGKPPTTGQFLKIFQVHGAEFLKGLLKGAGCSTEKPPTYNRAAKIAELYGVPVEGLREAISITFEGKSFSEEEITYVQPDTQDHNKLQSYAEHPNAAGLFYFRLRQSKMGREKRYISTVEMAESVGESKNYWHHRELYLDEISSTALSEMIHDGQRAGESVETIRSMISEMKVDVDNLTYLIAESMQGRDLDALIRASEISNSSIYGLFGGQQAIVTSSIVGKIVQGMRSLNPDLPRDFGAKVYRLAQPGIARFSPEALQDPARLVLAPSQIREYFEFDLREGLFRKRMDEGITKAEVGKVVGTSDVMVNKYERVVISEFSDETLLGMGKFFDRDPLGFYVPNHPDVLQLFELRDPATGKLHRLKQKDYEDLVADRMRAQDPTNLRGELHDLMRANQIETADALEGYMQSIKKRYQSDVDVAKLTKRLTRRRDEILYFEDILFLKLCFPALSVKKWYEHFYWARLVYFLEKNPDGSINYSFPEEVRKWDDINEDYVLAPIRQRINSAQQSLIDGGKSQAEARKGARALFSYELEEGLVRRVISEENLAKTARQLKIDRRALFFYTSKKELQTVLASVDQPTI